MTPAAPTLTPHAKRLPQTRRVMIYRAASVRGGPWIDVEARSQVQAEYVAIGLLRCVPGDLRYVVTQFRREATDHVREAM
jgi:hypothetical protein